MRLGRWEFKRHDPEVAEPADVHRDRLAELARILRGLPWVLGGGLAVPLTLGHFYRRHFDVDILFPRPAFPSIEAAMGRAGYVLSTHFPVSFFGAYRSALHVPVRCDGWLPRYRPRKLKFRDASGARTAPHLLGVVEAFPFTIEGDVYVSGDGRHRIPMRRPLVGHEHPVDDGLSIRCLDLHYVDRLKGRRDKARDREDRALIRAWLERTPVAPSAR